MVCNAFIASYLFFCFVFMLYQNIHIVYFQHPPPPLATRSSHLFIGLFNVALKISIHIVTVSLRISAHFIESSHKTLALSELQQF